MDAKLKLNLDQLTVESFAASTDEPKEAPRTCFNTQCGNIECCA